MTNYPTVHLERTNYALTNDKSAKAEVLNPQPLGRSGPLCHAIQTVGSFPQVQTFVAGGAVAPLRYWQNSLSMGNPLRWTAWPCTLDQVGWAQVVGALSPDRSTYSSAGAQDLIPACRGQAEVVRGPMAQS